jgi:hypothetical protein
LAPQFPHRHDARQEARLLLWSAERDQRRAQQFFADVVHPGRCRRPGVLLMEDHLLLQSRSPATELDRPAEAGPAVLRQMPVPRQTDVECLMFAPRTTQSASTGKVTGEISRQPASNGLAELFIRIGVHGASLPE